MRAMSFAGLAAGLAVAVGCDNTGRVGVEGTVSYDGQPIKAGAIAFVPLGDKGVSSGGAVIDGKYAVPDKYGPKAGKHRVEIRWAKPTGSKFKSESGDMLDMTEEGLPERYNNKSELTADLTSGKNVVNFDLKK
jgi:hypothetical protein